MSINKSFLLLSLILGLALAAKHLDHHKCSHDSADNPDPQVYDFEAELPEEERNERILASTTANTTYPQLRMKANFDALSDMTTDFQSYVANDLIPPLLDYFSAALKVKVPIATTIKMSSTTTSVCGLPTPAELYKGVATDFYWVIKGINEPDGDYVAQSYACFLDSKTKRPYAARTILNNGYMPVYTDDPIRHEKNMICVMHELTHTLGFSSSLFKYFLDSNGVLQNNVVQSVTLDGESIFVITAEPIKTKLRNYFGCPNLEGAFMENDGGSGNAGSHFERRQFGFEAMTSGLIMEMQYSQFSLAMLDSTGWYVVDYSYADPYFWGQGQGCNFLKQSCSDSNFTFDEFCTGTSRGCVNPGRGGGSCTDDSKSDGCTFYHPSANYDCENPDAADYARLPTLQTFGRGSGSKCFTGTLTTSKSASSTSFCFKNTCSGTGTNTTLTITVGTTQVKCTKEGSVTVKGYNGLVDCPDPVSFCNTVGKKVCSRGCMGRGKCIDGTCLCNAGFKGTDCALNA